MRICSYFYVFVNYLLGLSRGFPRVGKRHDVHYVTLQPMNYLG